jgi:hypothetical protein
MSLDGRISNLFWWHASADGLLLKHQKQAKSESPMAAMTSARGLKELAVRHLRLGEWGGLLALAGLLLGVFHEGIDWLAFRIVDVSGAEIAIKVVGEATLP